MRCLEIHEPDLEETPTTREIHRHVVETCQELQCFYPRNAMYGQFRTNMKMQLDERKMIHLLDRYRVTTCEFTTCEEHTLNDDTYLQ